MPLYFGTFLALAESMNNTLHRIGRGTSHKETYGTHRARSHRVRITQADLETARLPKRTQRAIRHRAKQRQIEHIHIVEIQTHCGYVVKTTKENRFDPAIESFWILRTRKTNLDKPLWSNFPKRDVQNTNRQTYLDSKSRHTFYQSIHKSLSDMVRLRIGSLPTPIRGYIV